MSGRPLSEQQVPQQRTEDEAGSIEKAIAALEGQRAILGDTVVDTAVAPLRERLDQISAPVSEQRRLVTVVFADLVDFTGLSRRLDAEDTREVVNAYFERWQEAIEQHGGVVEKFIGDAVMAVFGLRRSYEDDAHRAVRAALQIISGLEELNDALEPRYGVRLHLRVGVDTGEVVVSTLGERAGHEFVAVGPTVNRAARLQAAAPVDMVLVSSETRRQIRGVFGMEPQGALSLKGIDEPVEAWVVHTERRASFRIERAGGVEGVEGVETSTVGRDLQLRFLQERLADVADEGRWRVLTVMGDAGIGKTRLLFDFDAWLAERSESVWWFRGRASPTTQNNVNALLRDLLTARLGIQLDESVDQVQQRFVEGFGSALGPSGERDGLLAAAWLGYGVPSEETLVLPTDPQALRDQGTEALGRYFRALAEQAPVVVLLEDLHWADEGTLRWLDAVDPVLADAPVLVVATARPSLLETRPQWGEGLAHHSRLDLPGLSMRESRELVRQILQRVEQVPDSLMRMVIEAAEGNPFYIEELVTWLIDAGVVVKAEPQWLVVDELISAVAVPSTLKGVLQSRLDALSVAERGLLQRASVVGRVFWDAALGHTAPTDLDSLRHRQIVLQREVSRFASAREFLFKHALLRDVAYDGILRAQRERYHLATAEWLIEVSTAAGRGEEYAAIVAEHLDRAHSPDAASWYLRAGQRAASVFALEQAGSLLSRGLELASSPDLTFDVLEARESLLERLGDRDGQAVAIEAMSALPALDGARAVRLLTIRANIAFVHSEYDEARRLTGLAVQEAHALGRSDLRAQALLLQGKALTWAEETSAAAGCLQQAVAAGRSASLPSVVGEGLRYLGMLDGNTGDYDTSLNYLNQAHEVFARTGDTEMESAALAQKATTLFHMQRFAEAQEALEGTLPIFRRAGHRYREAIALGNLASIAVVQGRYADSDRWSREAIDICRDMDELEAIAVDLLVLAHGELFTGRFESCEEHASEALAIARQVGNAALEADALTRLVATAVVRGEFDAAISLGLEAVTAGEHASSDLDRGHSHLSLGYALRWESRYDEALTHFSSASSLFSGLSLQPLVREASVARAWVLASQGSVVEAVALVEPVLDHLTRDGLVGTCLPATMLRGCLDVLRLAGDTRDRQVLADARTYLHATAAEIGDPALEAGYLSIAPNAYLLS